MFYEIWSVTFDEKSGVICLKINCIEICTAVVGCDSPSTGATSAAGTATSALTDDINNTYFFFFPLPKSYSASM